MTNSFEVRIVSKEKGEVRTVPNVSTVVSNLHGYLISYTHPETGELEQIQVEAWDTKTAYLILCDPK